jgi:formamidopyrimidine-DNA glycosylase
MIMFFYQSITLPKKHNHVQIIFPKFKIIYNDPRRFGFFKLICNKEKLDLYFKKIGPEP